MPKDRTSLMSRLTDQIGLSPYHRHQTSPPPPASHAILNGRSLPPVFPEETTPEEPTSSKPLRTGRDVQQEIVLGLHRLNLSNDIEPGRVVAIGGYGDVYDAKLFDKKTNQWARVAAKKFRVMVEKEKEFAESFARELIIWARLQHTNILPLIGITVIDGMPVLASEWMENGTMNEYLKRHEDADILAVVQGIACGLKYLHDIEVVHADLKGDNVLITQDGRPLLSDFGISRLLINSVTIAGTTSIKGSTRWMAPELLIPEEGAVLKHSCQTKATDVWAFGMAVYEALSGNAPFHTLQRDPMVIGSILSRRRPAQPGRGRVDEKAFDLLWKCCNECWSYEPARRPTMAGVMGLIDLKRTLIVETTAYIRAKDCLLSPTGRFLAIRNDEERSISFLESKTMNHRGPSLGRGFWIESVSWSSTEDHIVTRSADGILRKWSNMFEAPTLVVHSMRRHDRASVKFSPDDRFIASVYKEARLWDASSLSLVWEYTGNWHSIAFHPLGNRLIFFSGRSSLDVNIEELENIIATERQFNHDIYDLAFNPSRNTCVARTVRGIKILSADTFEEKSSLPYDDCRRMQITPNGKYVLLDLGSKKVVLWDITAETAIEELSLDLSVLYSVEISRNCRVLLVRDCSDNRQIIHLASTYY